MLGKTEEDHNKPDSKTVPGARFEPGIPQIWTGSASHLMATFNNKFIVVKLTALYSEFVSCSLLNIHALKNVSDKNCRN